MCAQQGNPRQAAGGKSKQQLQCQLERLLLVMFPVEALFHFHAPCTFFSASNTAAMENGNQISEVAVLPSPQIFCEIAHNVQGRPSKNIQDLKYEKLYPTSQRERSRIQTVHGVERETGPGGIHVQEQR